MDELKDATTELLAKIDPQSKQVDNLAAIDPFIEELKNEITLTEVQRIIIDGELTIFFVEQYSTERLIENVTKHLTLENTNEADTQKIIQKINDFVKLHSNEPISKGTENSPVAAPEIGKDLFESKKIQPIIRNYSMEKDSGGPKKFDPYHEPIDPR